MVEVIRTLISRHLQQDLIDVLGPEKKKEVSVYRKMISDLASIQAHQAAL